MCCELGQLLVTTPFSLARLLEVQFFNFHRLCHLILDEAHELFSRAPEQVRRAKKRLKLLQFTILRKNHEFFSLSLYFKMTAILQHYKKVVSREERTVCVQQIVAVGRHWCRELEMVARNHMVHPCIIITLPEEAALYGGVQQVSGALCSLYLVLGNQIVCCITKNIDYINIKLIFLNY